MSNKNPRVTGSPLGNQGGAEHPTTKTAKELRAVFSQIRQTIPQSLNKYASNSTENSGYSDISGISEEDASETPLNYTEVKSFLHTQLLDSVDDRPEILDSEAELKKYIEVFLEAALQEGAWPLNAEERLLLAEDLLQETLGLGPLAPLLNDPAITDILVNGFKSVYVERYGKLEETDCRFRNEAHLTRIIQRIANKVGRRIDHSSPMVDARLPDGSRVNATLPPVTLDGPTLSIRRFGQQRIRNADLLRLKMFSEEMQTFFKYLILGKFNLLVSGGTGAGKSTALAGLAENIPPTERLITIEDSAELRLDQKHVVRMETRPANTEGAGRIIARDLVINALRMRPDRIIVGEVRGGEALDMLQSMNTGHDGSLTTIHANSPRDSLARLETMVLMAELDLPSRAIREQIASAIDFIIHVRRYEDGIRRVESVTELVGIEENQIQLQEIFRFTPTERRKGKITGLFEATGIVPRAVERLKQRQIEVPLHLFSQQRRG
ncbi:MAG: CpaF family protein [Pirellulaceae bacterium]|nr:CpaF family protein [Pirellulaceae bacterium]